MSGEKYMGLDVHQATISVAVVDSQGKVVMESILETKADLQQTGAGNPRQRGISLRGWASAAAQKTGDDSRLEQIWGEHRYS